MFLRWSDTTSLIRKYSDHDSVPEVAGWGFHFYRCPDTTGTTVFLSDTLLHQKHFKRAVISKSINGIPCPVECFFDCSRPHSPFDLSPGLSQQAGCPLSRLYYSSPLRTGLHFTSEVKLVSPELTPAEQQVFNTYKAYAGKNPVYRN